MPINNVYFFPHQKLVFDKRAEGYNEILMTSGTGAGKTWFGARYTLLEWLQSDKKDKAVLLAISPNIGMAKKTIIREMNKVLDEWGLINNKEYVFNKTERSYYFKSNGAIIYVLGAEAFESMQGIHPTYIWADECGQYNQEAWQTIEQRASYTNAFLLGTSTPYRWNYYKTKVDLAISGKKKGSYAFRVPSIANPLYPKEVYYQRQKLWAKWKFDMMYNGMFTSPKGLIYQNFRECLVSSFDIPEHWERWGAIDYGSVHPTAILWFTKDPQSGVIYVFDEWVESNKNITDIECQLTNVDCRYYADTSGKQITATLNSKGYDVVNAIKDVESGIMLVNSLINDNKLKIFNECIKLQQEGFVYSWKLDKSDNPTNKPNKLFDDAMDALRYGIVSHLQNKEEQLFYVGDNCFQNKFDYLDSLY